MLIHNRATGTKIAREIHPCVNFVSLCLCGKILRFDFSNQQYRIHDPFILNLITECK